MQCLRCSYIQFKSFSKCANCGYDFKKLKSSALVEAENTFTIFATAGAEARAAFNDTSDETGYQPESPNSEFYDTSQNTLADLNESHVDEFGNFKLDLSETNGPDSESWNIGATLAEDLSETTSPVSEDFMKEADLDTGDFEVQGLGFDLNDDLGQTETEESNEAATAKEASPETNDFFLSDSEENSADDAGEISLETELTSDDIEPEAEPASEAPVALNVPEIELDSTPEITLEPSPELELDSTPELTLEPSPEVELDSTPEITLEPSPEVEPDPTPEIKPDPTPELDELQLDLKTDSLEIEPVQKDQPTAPETPLEDLELKMDTDEESTPDR